MTIKVSSVFFKKVCQKADLNKVVKTKVMKSSYLLGPISNVKFFGFITLVKTVDKKEPQFLFSSMNN